MSLLNSFMSELNVVIIGASGGLGKAFIEILEQDSKVASIHAFSRSCLLYTSPSPRDGLLSRMPSSA